MILEVKCFSRPPRFYRKIRQIIDTFGSNLHVELQQRGIEFSQLFRKYDHLRPALLERMPPMETAKPQANGIIGMVNGDQDVEEEKPAAEVSPSADSSALLDLLGSSDLGMPSVSSPATAASPAITPVNNNDLLDLLGGLDLTSTPAPAPVTQIQSPSAFSPTNFLVDGLLSSAPQNDVQSMIIFDNAGLKITFKVERATDSPDLLVINMTAVNTNATPLTDFLFQAAVPRVCSLNSNIYASTLIIISNYLILI